MDEVKVVEILPTRIWIVSGIFGDRSVMCQHQGREPFRYAQFFYDWAYTSNVTTRKCALDLAISLGAQEPVEEEFEGFPEAPSVEAIQAQIDGLQSLLKAKQAEGESTDRKEN